MQAVVVHDYDEGAHLEDVDVLDPQANEVVVRVAASGVCASDLHVLHGRSPVASLPMVLGHEGAGVVERVGPDVRGLAVGDHVVLALYGPCGECASCRAGNPVHCDGAARVQAIFGRAADGTTRLRQGGEAVHPMVGVGSLAEHAIVREAQAVKIDDDIPLDLACLAGCGVTTGIGAVLNIAEVPPGASVAVVGCGGVGLNVLQGARLSGATTIIGIDANADKLPLATRFGATHTVDAAATDMASAVREIVVGGVDYAFEVVGDPDLVAATFELTRPGGTCVMVGSPPPGSTIPIDGRSLFSERRLLGCTGGSNVPARDIPRIMRLWRAGSIDLDGLVSQRLPLDAFKDAFDALERGTVARSVIVL
ncbi:MAG TPA: Zn-dependent alcohol dehydrogenase [Acidimicrobiia bacterium]